MSIVPDPTAAAESRQRWRDAGLDDSVALLRAIGASRRQVSRALLVESTAMGVVGSVIGFGIGILLSQLLSALLKARLAELRPGDNPWDALTPEWLTSSPPPVEKPARMMFFRSSVSISCARSSALAKHTRRSPCTPR